MNLSRCENGHFYDKEKYAACPHCSQGAGEDNSLTTIFTEDLNTGTMETQPMSDSTLPIGGIPANEPVMTASADDATVPLNPPMMTTPLPEAEWAPVDMGSSIPSAPPVEEDDDHTEAFYDDIFNNVAKAQQVPGARQTSAPAVQNRVTTPCVGWLIAIGGEHIGQDFRLKVGKNFIGRDAKMDIALTGDKSVSRNRHAIVVYEPKRHLYMVQPGESSELVYRNNEVVLNPIGLEAYDMITVGEVNLLFIPLCGERFNWSDVLEEMGNKEKDD